MAGKTKMSLEDFKDRELTEGVDYGKVKGIPKPFLSLAGAQKIAKYYGHKHLLTIQESVENHAERFYFYRVNCLIHDKDGVPVGNIVGSCSTHDSGKQKAPPNSILKMAEKRAYVSAILYVVAGSGLFSVDVEEMSTEELTGSEDGIKWFPSKWSNGFCGACGNKHIEQGAMVSKVDGKWVAKDCYNHVKSVESSEPPKEEPQDDKFRAVLEQMERDQLEQSAWNIAEEKRWGVDNFDGMDKEGLVNFIMECRK